MCVAGSRDSPLPSPLTPLRLSRDKQDTAIASLYLSTKLCETPIRLKTLLATYLIVLRRTQHLRRSLRAEDPQMRDLEEAAQSETTFEVPPAHASVWWSIKEAVCVAEMQILKRLGFNMQVRNSLVGVPLGKMGERLLS